MIMFWKDILVILIYLNKFSCGLQRPSNIVFQNNGYANVVVAISDNVPEDQGLIDTIKTALTATSKQLYSSTKKRAYFKDISILVPNSWTNNPSYGAATTQSLRMADIVVSKPIQRHQRHVMTRSYSGCGKSGIHIQLLTDFFTNPGSPPACSTGGSLCYSKDELIARRLVHDWANFRWGVYNEYPTEGESQFYFSTLTGRPEAVRCSTGLRGSIFKTFPNGTGNPSERCLRPDPATGMFPDGCKYFPYPYRNMAKASIMDHEWINEITEFCDDDKTPRSQTAHNAEPPNKHNRLCSHRSTWDVISNTSDFKAGVNPPRDISPSQLVPQFHVVKASSTKRIAIILDHPSDTEQVFEKRGHADFNISHQWLHFKCDRVKFTLVYFRRIKKRDIHQAIGAFVYKRIDNGNEVVVLQNSKENKVLHPLTKVKSYQDRQSVINSLMATNDEKESQIDLTHTLEILHGDVNKQEKHIIFIGCGNASLQANEHTIKTFNDIGVQFHSILFDGSGYFSNDKLQNLGQINHVLSNQGHNSLLDGLHEISTVIRKPSRKSIKLFSESEILIGGAKDFTGHFWVDTMFKYGIEMIVTYKHTMPTLTFRSPTGKLHNGQNIQHDENIKLLIINIDPAMVGEWSFTMKGNTDIDDLVSVIISAETDTSIPTIELSAHVEKLVDFSLPAFAIFARINKGHNPIIDLNVTAVIESPGGALYFLKLLDNGAGADTERQDGIYSRYFTRVKEAGYYNIRIEAKHDKITKTFTELIYNEQHRDSIHLYHNSNNGLSRSISGSVYVTEKELLTVNDLESKFNHPPSRIKDLKIERISRADQTLTLTWTAPGDDLDHGSASSYDVRYDNNGIRLIQLRDNARSLPSELIMHHKGPKEAGEREIMILKIPELHYGTVSFAFIIRAVDKYGNVGEFSNLATGGIQNAQYVVVNTAKEKSVERPVILLFAIVIAILFIAMVSILGKSYMQHGKKNNKNLCPA